MVVGETDAAKKAAAGQQDEGAAAAGAVQPLAGIVGGIDNIMSGIGNTGTVKMNNHRKKLRQRFDIIKKLGQGTYGKVQLGINKETSQEVAIKTIKKCKIETEADLIRIRREVQIMSSVQHPNIIHIYEVFENREKMVLVMEFAAGGELYDYLSERKVLAEDEARRVFRQISTAVYYCHKHKICHRDLKLENILLDEHGNAKIADFGLSNVFDEQRLLATFCGSPLYASPEIVKGTPYQGPEVDCWSLGVLLYTLVYGAMPFDGSNFKRLVKQISQGDYYEPKKPSPASPLIREMLTVCPQRRANIEQICNHWWVNEGYPESCLDLAEELANQTPVRLDVLLSLAPSSVTADQLVVPNPEEIKGAERVVRSHSVGSIVDMANTEAEQRIIDMVQAGGEAAIMPSPTRTITPSVENSPAQPKRKLETTMSMENATGAKKKEKSDLIKAALSKHAIAEAMDVESEDVEAQNVPLVEEEEQEIFDPGQDNIANKDENLSDAQIVPSDQELSQKQKALNKNRTTELIATINEVNNTTVPMPDVPVRKNSLPEECLTQTTGEKRRSRILETAERLQSMANQNQDKLNKFPSQGAVGSVSNFKKEFERKASLTSMPSVEKKSSPEKIIVPSVAEKGSMKQTTISAQETEEEEVKSNDSRTSLHNFSLEEARRSMENSIALLNKARNESNPDMDQLCEKTENVAVSKENVVERQRKLKNAREIIGNAIPTGRLCMGVRKPPVPFGQNGRSISGSVVPTATSVRPTRLSDPRPELKQFEDEPTKVVGSGAPEPLTPSSTVKTSRAEIVLKSATLPRRKPAKTEIQLDIKTDNSQPNSMRFSTEIQHQMPDLRSAPIPEHPPHFSTSSMGQHRATSLEPRDKEHFAPIVRPPSSTFTNRSSTANTFRTLSRQSTNDSDTDTTTTATQSQINIAGTNSNNNQPIKKSPREFIIPIAVEGGGLITPRAGSLEPSDSGSTFRSSTTTTSRPKRLSSLLSERESEDDSLFGRMHRHTSLSKDGDLDDPQRFPSLHRLRSTRPLKKVTQDPNDSGSSGEDDDDEDGFEILTAEKLFSTLLQRVRALTNRVNVNNDTTSAFPSSRFMSSLRQSHSPFWHHDPFADSSSQHYSYRSETTETKVHRLNNGVAGHPWHSQMTRDLTSNIDNMFSRSGATLPRGTKFKDNKVAVGGSARINGDVAGLGKSTGESKSTELDGELDLRDLDLSQLRLTKKELETLSSLTLPKKVQDQLLAQLPPNQAKKLSRTLSMQNNPEKVTKTFKRSLSGGREFNDTKPDLIKDVFDLPNQHRRSLSKSNQENGLDKESRSSSRCRDSGEDFSRSLRSSYSSDTSDKYKLLSSESGNQISIDNYPTFRYYETLPARSSCVSPTSGRPPISGCLSPPPIPPDGPTVRRRSTQRRISRFLRPDFFDTPREESIYVDKSRDSGDSTRVLRDIRERSGERVSGRDLSSSRDRLNFLTDKYSQDNRKSCMPDIQNHFSTCPQYSPELIANTLENIKTRRRSLSRSRDKEEDAQKNQSVNEEVLAELQFLSSQTSTENKRNSQLEKDENAKILNTDLVTKLTNQIDSVSLLNDNKQKDKRESKLIRPKSYPSKEQERSKKSSPESTTKEEDADVNNNPKEQQNHEPEIQRARSKLFQPSKITPPKEIVKKALPPREETASPKKEKKSASKSPAKSTAPTTTEPAELKPKKTVKVTKKNSPSKTDLASEKADKKNEKARPEKSPEKVAKKGFLQSISQKFEKLKESSMKSKDKKLGSTAPSDKNNNVLDVKCETTSNNLPIDFSENNIPVIPLKLVKEAVPKKSTVVVTEENGNDVTVVVTLKKKTMPKEQVIFPEDKSEVEKQIKIDKKSKIDDMIRNLRERSVPRGPQLTESHLIKRAVSVEEMPGTFNKCSVNKVLGLFKKIEKESKIQGTNSSVLLSALPEPGKERPKSSGFVSKLKKTYPYVGAKSDSIVSITDQQHRIMDKANGNVISKIPTNKNCPDCRKEDAESVVTKRETKQSKEDKDRIRNNRKGLMLDLNQNCTEKNQRETPNQTPLTEMGASMSSDSKRSTTFDDCGASSSTFMSPTDDHELCFDNWSICSEERYNGITSPPPIRPLSSTTHQEYDPENMLDRIRRKSFYTRFNEKKPKRVSSIVGPGATKDYYNRDGTTARPPEYRKSPTVTDHTKSDYYRPSRAPAKSTENGLTNGYRLSSIDYLNNNKDFHLPPSSSSSSRRSDELKKLSDYSSAKAPRIPITTSSSRSNALYSLDNSSNSSIYGTYNPKRRISYNNGHTSSALPEAMSYATLGRKPKTYDQRTMSLLEGSGIVRRDSRPAIDYGNLRTSYRVRTPSVPPPRNTTNI